MNLQLQRLWWQGVRSVGVPGMVAIGLLLPALAIGILIPGFHQRSDELRATLVQRANEIAQQGKTVRRPMTSGERIGEFVAAFPPLAQSSADLQQVFEAASKHGLALPRGDYQLKVEPNTPLASLTATFPVRNEYGVLKTFTADVLSTLPHVSMDELRMTRSDAGTGVLDSTIRFTFVYRSP